MNSASTDMVTSQVKVDPPLLRRFTEINKYGDNTVPPFIDINVYMVGAYANFSPGMRWVIRLAQESTLKHLRQDNPPHVYLCEVCDGEQVRPAIPQFVDQLFEARLNIIVVIENSEGGQRELLIWPEPF
jgi:hypothetical protein